MSHGGAAAAQENTAKMFLRDRLQVPQGLGDPGDVPGLLPNSIAYFPVLFAAQQHLLRWAAGGGRRFDGPHGAHKLTAVLRGRPLAAWAL